MGGAFQTSRGIFDNPIWQNIVEFRLFFLIYGQAVFSEEGARIGNVTLKRGQWLRSIRNLQKDLEYIENRAVKSYSTSTLKRAIDSLVKQNRIEVESVELGTLFTVVNYQQYQGLQNYSNKNLERTENADGTDAKQRQNNNNNGNNGEKVSKKTSRPKQVYDADSTFMKMVEYFLTKIREWKPDFVMRGSKQKWADEFRLMHDKDERSKEDIKKVIDFVTSDPFEQPNVMSPGKLRERFDSLTGKIKNKGKIGQPNNYQPQPSQVYSPEMPPEVRKRLEGMKTQ